MSSANEINCRLIKDKTIQDKIDNIIHIFLQ